MKKIRFCYRSLRDKLAQDINYVDWLRVLILKNKYLPWCRGGRCTMCLIQKSLSVWAERTIGFPHKSSQLTPIQTPPLPPMAISWLRILCKKIVPLCRVELDAEIFSHTFHIKCLFQHAKFRFFCCKNYYFRLNSTTRLYCVWDDDKTINYTVFETTQNWASCWFL